jgi:GT2 family glycosyltransferase
MKPLVCIVVLNYNGWQDTVECLTSLERLDYPNYQVVVVDNASCDGSEEKIRKRYADVTVIQSGANLGFAGGNNVGIRHALEHGADYVWLLNNDTVVEPHALHHLVERMRAEPDIGMCGSKLIYYHHRGVVQALGGARYNKWFGVAVHLGQNRSALDPVDAAEVERSLDYVTATSMLVSRRFLEDIGLMNESYFLYFEEIDWALRAKGRYRLAFAERSVVYHKEGRSIGSNNHTPQSKSYLADCYSLKNRLAVTKTFFPLALPTVYLGLFASLLLRLRRSQWDRASMILTILIGRNVTCRRAAGDA